VKFFDCRKNTTDHLISDIKFSRLAWRSLYPDLTLCQALSFSASLFLAVVKKTLRYSNVFLQPLKPAFRISELILEKRYYNDPIFSSII
jgi:hypothetical protein